MTSKFEVNKIEYVKTLPKFPEDDDIRDNFQKDRDKILYSKAFRRLSGKTQVFVSVKDDHVRTRLTHTLEVAQIAKTISEALGLNSNLTEAIALAHDIGHTPFGHVGERTLNQITNGCYTIKNYNENILSEYKGFKHNLQGVRVLSELEEEKLSISKETLVGILNHSSLSYSSCDNYLNLKCTFKNDGKICDKNGKTLVDFYSKYKNYIDKYWSFEAFVVEISDEIAQRHHDIEDAIEFNIINIEELKEKISTIFEENSDILCDKSKNFSMKKFASFIIDKLIKNVIETSKCNLESFINAMDIKSNEDFLARKESFSKDRKGEYIKGIIGFSEKFKQIDLELKKFLKNNVLFSYEAQRMDGIGKYVIRNIFKAYLENPQQLPNKTIKSFYKMYLGEKYLNTELLSVGELRIKLYQDHAKKSFDDEKYKSILIRVICDYISGMTDNYAIKEHKKLYNV